MDDASHMMLWPLVLAGLWIIADGIGSLVIYREQRWYEQLVRAIRICAGIVAIYFGMIW